MQERHHVKTVPGEPAAPEFVPHPVRKEDGHQVQTDDINIPLVAIFVVFFAILLAVVIVSLQAWFYGYQDSERQRKLAPQESKLTALGALLHEQRTELVKGPSVAHRPANATQQANAPKSVPIDQAMTIVANQYANRGANNR